MPNKQINKQQEEQQERISVDSQLEEISQLDISLSIGDEQEDQEQQSAERQTRIKNALDAEEAQDVQLEQSLVEEKQEAPMSFRLKEIGLPPEGQEAMRTQKSKADPAQASKDLKDKALRDLFFKMEHYISYQVGDVDCIAMLLNQEEKGSASFQQMRYASRHMQSVANRIRKGEKVSNGMLMEAIMLVSETAQCYIDLHESTIRYTQKGVDRRKAAFLLRRLCTLFYNEYDKISGGQGLRIRPDKSVTVGASPEEIKKAGKRIRELGGNLKKWKKHFAFQEARERENIRDKASLFEVYARDIEIYKATRDEKDWSSEVGAVIREYEYYKLQNKLLDQAEKEEDGHLVADMHTDSVRAYAEELDERKKKEKALSKEEIDTGLTEEQLVAVERIDRWFIRNYNNAGLVGRLFKVRNHHGDIISELFHKTKRERLFIYYLIENGKRKIPNYIDVYRSQTTYVPDLDKFKSVMLSTKLKVADHATGTYVYMHKLSEAMQVNREYKDLVRDCHMGARAAEQRLKEREEKEKKDKKESGDNLSGVKLPKEVIQTREQRLQSRNDALYRFYGSTQAYRDKLIACQKEQDKEKKKTLEAEAKELADLTKEDLKVLIDADNAIGEDMLPGVNKHGYMKQTDVVQNRPDMLMQDAVDGYSQLSTVGGGALSFTPTAYNFVTKGIEKIPFIDVKWHLSDSAMARPEFYSGAINATVISGLAQIASSAFAIWHLSQTKDNMHKGDLAAGVAGILQSLGGIATTVWKGVEKGNALKATQSVEKAGEVAMSTGLKAATAVTAGMGVMLSSYKLTTSFMDGHNTTKAQYFLEQKRNQAFDHPVSEDEYKEISKELKYEQNMLNLSRRMNKYKKVSAVGKVLSSSISMAGVFVPGLGSLISFGGTAVGLLYGIWDVVRLGKVRDKMFDEFFDVKTLVEREIRKVESRGRIIVDKEDFRERMRRKLAASLGYADVITACDQIARRYADFICKKLYGPPEGITENEKNGYIQLIKSFGLPYNEEEQIPSPYLLARRMAGR